MSTRVNVRALRPSGPRRSTPKPGLKKTVTEKSLSRRGEKEILQLVRTGVERFILRNATMEEFLRTTRAVAEREEVYSHQLTRSVFAKIVKEAIRKRNRRKSE